jgi:UDP-N-acetylmuramyl pentapeptide phosphotransferase/UDP-N-acetylglucosamine-1-phosphate transferase
VIPLIPFAAVWLCTSLVLLLAPVLRLVDAPEDAPERKKQSRPIPIIGGTALLFAGAILWFFFGPESFGFEAEFDDSLGLLGLALGLAFLVGLIDDLKPGGLSPVHKLLGQAIASTPMAVAAMEVYGPSGAWLAVPAGIVAMNLANTYDNSDGALTSLAALSLGPVAPVAAIGLCGFLPFNVGRMGLGHAPTESGSNPEPRAYLGDSGSHLIGMLVLAYPPAWAFFLLPALDLARVSLLRIQAGRHIWSGDRWHLAHRFEDRGFSTGIVLLALGSIALPAVGAPWLEHFAGRSPDPFLGALLTTLIFFVAVGLSRKTKSA